MLRTTMRMRMYPVMAVVFVLMGCGSSGGGPNDASDATGPLWRRVCANVTCSGHGICSVVKGAATCACDLGYAPSGATECVDTNPTAFDNPIIKYDTEDPTNTVGDYIYTADAAAMVWNNKVYLYTGHDLAVVDGPDYVMHDWRLWTSTDMVKWTNVGSVATYSIFPWARDNAWAGQVTERDDAAGNPKFYFYAPVDIGSGSSFLMAIGVAVADSPEGPFSDPRGIPLISPDMTKNDVPWADIDPAIFVDDDGQAYLYWGNSNLKYVKLEDDMIHIKGEVYTENANGTIATLDASAVEVTLADVYAFTEAPWLHKHDGIYYMSYASQWPEQIAYSTSTSPTGPWIYRGVIEDYVVNSNTTHQSIIDFNGASFMTYHNGALPEGSSYRRSVCVDRLYYNEDGTIKKVKQTWTSGRTGKRIRPINFPLYWLTYGGTGATVTAISQQYATQRLTKTEWNLAQGLAHASDPAYVSFQSVFDPAVYMYDTGVYNFGAALDASHTIRLGAPPTDPDALASFQQAATFKKVPGLADGIWSSFQSYAAPNLYLRHFGYVLYVQDVTDGSTDATWELVD